MKLLDYVKKEAKKDNVSIVSYMSRIAYKANMPLASFKTYMYEDRKPGAVAAVRLYKATNKEVTLNDLLLGDDE
jgi:hypothetical protein